MNNNLKELFYEPSLLNIFKKAELNNNKLSLAVISLFPLLFVTKSIEAALIFGLVMMILMLITTTLVFSLKKHITNSIKLPVLMITLISFAVVAKLLLNAFNLNIVRDFGIYIIMLGVSPLLYIQAFYTDKCDDIITNYSEAMGSSLGLLVVLLVTAVFREILGTGAITIGRYLPFGDKVISLGFEKYAITSFTEAYGALIVFGLILAVYQAIKLRKSGEEA